MAERLGALATVADVTRSLGPGAQSTRSLRSYQL